MALSTKAKIRLDDAFGSKADSKAFQAAIAGRTALSAKLKAATVVAFAASKKISNEIIAAVASGAALSKEAKRLCLVMMGKESDGNELANTIQSSATAPIKL